METTNPNKTPTKIQVDADIKAAMLSKNSVALSVLRMAKTAIINAEKEKGTEVEEKDVILLIRREIKKRQDSIDAFVKANRIELANKEENEIKILSVYLPKELSQKELLDIVTSSISETGAGSKKQMGAVMKLAMEKANGQVDGKTLSALIQKYLP